MCGILAICGKSAVDERLMDGLARLEYRGYDSAGLAVPGPDGIWLDRSLGNVECLRQKLAQNPPPPGSTCGIAHTRWATHGRASMTNAHPHLVDGVAIVHNGIVENFHALAKELQIQGHAFGSETDSEIIAHMIADNLRRGLSAHEAVLRCSERLAGSYAFIAMFADEPGLLIAVCAGSPLVVGMEEDEIFIGSDPTALVSFARNITHLEPGDLLVARPGQMSIDAHDGAKNPFRPTISYADNSAFIADMAGYDSFMEKEIAEQPEALSRSLHLLLDPVSQSVLPNPPLHDLFANADRAIATACGTAYYAACVGKYWFEEIARLGLETDIASEFRYRSPCLPQRGPALFVSQSGETADTMAAMEFCRQHHVPSIGIVNVQGSSLSRRSDIVLHSAAGPEIGVASTKAFTAQLAVLAVTAIAAARARNSIDKEQEQKLVQDLLAVPRLVASAMAMSSQMQQIAETIAEVSSILYLGRGAMYPLAMEGALKLKELSYIQAEGYAAGELKHGPLALIEPGIPVIIIAPFDDVLFAKTMSGLEEVAARGARTILITDPKGAELAKGRASHLLNMPEAPRFVQPIIAAIPIQFLALHTAKLLGRNIDKPRNLAKSVTVE